jgi:hypothetical protein
MSESNIGHIGAPRLVGPVNRNSLLLCPVFGDQLNFAETVGKVDEEVVKKYIRQQRGNP